MSSVIAVPLAGLLLALSSAACAADAMAPDPQPDIRVAAHGAEETGAAGNRYPEPEAYVTTARESRVLAVQLAEARRALDTLPEPAMTPAELETLILAKREDPATGSDTLLALVQELHRSEAYAAARARVEELEKALTRQHDRETRLQMIVERGRAEDKILGELLTIFK
ncbi:MAG: hypothetical protein ACE5FS_11290 [Paracoccaceae bacterium]